MGSKCCDISVAAVVRPAPSGVGLVVVPTGVVAYCLHLLVDDASFRPTRSLALLFLFVARRFYRAVSLLPGVLLCTYLVMSGGRPLADRDSR